MRPTLIFKGILRGVVSISGRDSGCYAWRIAVLIPVFLLAITGEVRSQTGGHPDLVLHSGKIVTVDEAFRVVEAVAISAQNYDPESIARWTVPVKSMIEAGLHPAFHTDGHDGGPMLFLYLQTMLTRRDEESGRVWNLLEAIDRKDVLRSATRWGAEYTLREDEIGSIEAGKWADMIVIDRDYLSIPVEEIGRIQVLTTFVGGKIVYQRP
ncbi:MAG: amidohydrolase family protein [Acidobacteria bacterium]|nr:amidohydrolase family protein [Acidobacteriota bacterium]